MFTDSEINSLFRLVNAKLKKDQRNYQRRRAAGKLPPEYTSERYLARTRALRDKLERLAHEDSNPDLPGNNRPSCH